MKRIDRLAVRIAALTAKQDAEQNWPRFVLHLSDGSTAELMARLPEALVRLTELHIMPEQEVLSIDKPKHLDSLTEQLYELFECIVMGGSSVSDARTPFYGKMIHIYCRQRNPQRMKRYPNEITI